MCSESLQSQQNATAFHERHATGSICSSAHCTLNSFGMAADRIGRTPCGAPRSETQLRALLPSKSKLERENCKKVSVHVQDQRRNFEVRKCAQEAATPPRPNMWTYLTE